MAFGAPTCPACSVAGLCKEDLNNVGGADADRLMAIQLELRKTSRVQMATFSTALLSVLGTLSFMMINFKTDLGLISTDSIFWILALAFGPMFVLMTFMMRLKNQATFLLRERDAIIRDRHVKLAHEPRDGYHIHENVRGSYRTSSHDPRTITYTPWYHDAMVYILQ